MQSNSSVLESTTVNVASGIEPKTPEKAIAINQSTTQLSY